MDKNKRKVEPLSKALPSVGKPRPWPPPDDKDEKEKED